MKKNNIQKMPKAGQAGNGTKPHVGGSCRIFTTHGVYANGDWKSNGVIKSNLEEHKKYNIENRPGRAFFINGVCHHKGYLTDDQVAFYEKLFSSDCKYSRYKDSQPYH